MAQELRKSEVRILIRTKLTIPQETLFPEQPSMGDENLILRCNRWELEEDRCMEGQISRRQAQVLHMGCLLRQSNMVEIKFAWSLSSLRG